VRRGAEHRLSVFGTKNSTYFVTENELPSHMNAASDQHVIL